MSKIKLDSQKGVKRIKLKKAPKPCQVGFKYHLGDTAGCGYIRCIFPCLLMNNMVDKDLKVEALYTNQYVPMPQHYTKTTFAIFQRSATPQQLEMVKHFKSIRKTTSMIYEIDDNLFDIPDWNFAKDFYVKNKESAEMILRQMDGIATSTEFLKKEYTKYNHNVVVTPNHLPRFLWGHATFQPNEHKKIRIMYAGSQNHFAIRPGASGGDMDIEFINYILDTVDKYDWYFVGGAPKQIMDNITAGGGVHYVQWQNIMSLPLALRDVRADIALAPLEDNRFNASKSNIKALEGTALGLPMVCSDVGPYKGLPGVTKTTTDMINRIEELAGSVDKRQEQWEHQFKALDSQLFWEEHDNIKKYVNKYLRLVKMTL